MNETSNTNSLFLESKGYIEPILSDIKIGNFNLIKGDNQFRLFVGDEEWMSYNLETQVEAKQLFSHYYLAKGHVICTGLGLGIRENWILSKKEVLSLTIVEKNHSVIDFHIKSKSSLLKDKRVKIVNQDARKFTSSCDVLLIDHFNDTSEEEIFSDINILNNNITSNICWFWPLESIVSDFNSFKKLKNSIINLPSINEEEFNLFKKLYFDM